VRGGSGWEQFRRRKAGGWIGSGQRAREEGGEAVGRGNLGGVARLRRNPARRSGGGSVSRGERKGKAAGERGGSIGFCSSARFVEEKERERDHAARHRAAGGAGVPDGAAWRPLESVYPTWKSEGRPSRVMRAVGGGIGRRVERDQDGAELQVLGGGRRQESRARVEE
jgi:hypothetical protein